MAVDYTKIVAKVGIITILLNTILSIAKVIGGILAHASSLLSDGIHSFSDVLSTIVVVVGAKLSHKKADKEHPFGHERLESVSCMILAFLLAITALSMGYNGIMGIISYSKGKAENGNTALLYLGLGFAIASIIVKGWMYFYTNNVAKRIHSQALHADAIHHLTDSISSIVSVIGIIGLLCGGSISIFDPIAAIIIALFILHVAYDILKLSLNQLVDKAAPDEIEKELERDILGVDGVIRINSLRTRIFGNKIYVELEIAVLDTLSVVEGHDIAKNVHNTIERKYPIVKHIMIHVDPASEEREE